MIAGAYLRKSNDQSDTSADVKSVPVQKALIAAFAAKRGFTLDERFIYSDDGVSGAAFRERPGLQALLAALNRHPRSKSCSSPSRADSAATRFARSLSFRKSKKAAFRSGRPKVRARSRCPTIRARSKR